MRAIVPFLLLATAAESSWQSLEEARAKASRSGKLLFVYVYDSG